MDGEHPPTLADCFNLIRRRFVIIALAGVLGALLGLAYLAKAEPGYESTARLVLQQVPASPGISGVSGGISPATTLTATQKSILRSDEVAQRAVEDLGGSFTVDQLLNYSSVEILPDSLTLDVTYQADDQVEAQAGAQALVDSYLDLRQGQEEARRSAVVDRLTEQLAVLDEALVDTVQRLEKVDPAESPTTETVLTAQLTSRLSEQGGLKAELNAWQSLDTTPGSVVSPAELPEDSTSLAAPLVLIGAIAAALIAGFVVAFIRDRTDPKVRSSQDLQELVGSTPVNVISADEVEDENTEWFGEWFGRTASRHAPGVEVAANGNGAEAESYRRLALRLGGWEGPGPRFLLVTSAGSAPAEEVAANLAVTLGREGNRVLLIWSNLREDTLSAYFSVPEGPGLREVLASTAKLEDAVLEIPGCQGLYLLPVGARGEARDQLFRFSGLKDVLTACDGTTFDQIVLIAPSPADYADALALAPQVDGVLVTVESESVDRKELTATVESLRSINANLAGVVAL